MTRQGKDLLPVMLEMILWSAKHDPKTAASSAFVNKARKALSSTERKTYLAELIKDLP